MKKLLLLGIGRWGANHLRVLRSLPIDLHVCDTSPELLAKAVEDGLPENRASTKLEDFFDQVDGAVVVTPAPTHFDLCRRFLESGRDVFVEKPITLKSTEAAALVELADQKSAILQVGHIFRFDTASRWLKEHVQNGSFGELRLLRGNFSGFKRPRSDSGMLLADAIHFVDLFTHLVGAMPRSVTAHLRDFLGRGMEDSSLLTLDYATPGAPDAAGIVEASYFLPGKFREVTLIGSKLSAVCDYNVAQYKIKTYANQHVEKGDNYEAVQSAVEEIESTPEEPLLAELRAFVDSMETRKQPLADGRSGYESIKVLEAAYESAKTGRRVEIHDD